MYVAEHPVWAEIRLDHIRHNVREIRRRLPGGVKFMAVVKANGYGQGLVPAARAAVAAGADALAAGSLAEGVRLREAGIQAPILILSPIFPEQVDTAVRHELQLTVFQADWLREMRRHKKTKSPVAVHIKMDTGMGRWGLRERGEFSAMVPLLKSEDVRVAGVFTHFAAANQADVAFTRRQFERFRDMRGWLEEEGFADAVAHCANSAAAIRFPEYALDMVRVGASLYGIVPIDPGVVPNRPVRLKPTLSLYTVIGQVKRISPGDVVGYDGCYTAQSEEWIATLPVGYADGWFRGYQGMRVMVGDVPVPIVGKICMNQTMVRLPEYKPVGTKVTLIGSGISLDEAAAHLGTIPQQVLMMIPESMPRVWLA